jgi:UDP-N-acetylmuramyl pentapeptide synthase
MLDACVRGGDLVLLKGSRGCALEQLSGMLTGIPAPAPAQQGAA